MGRDSRDRTRSRKCRRSSPTTRRRDTEVAIREEVRQMYDGTARPNAATPRPASTLDTTSAPHPKRRACTPS